MTPSGAGGRCGKRWREQELSRLVDGLKGMGAQKVILFGSWGRGEGADWSDLDILVVMRSDLPFVERMGEIYRRLRPCEADVFVYTPEEMEEGNPVIRRALAEGKVLYEKPH